MGEFVDAANKLRDQLYRSTMKRTVKGARVSSNKFVKVSDGRVGVVISWFVPDLTVGWCLMWFGEIEDGQPKLVELPIQEDWELCP